MLQGESEKLLAGRLQKLEDGVSILDTRVAALDDKVSHVIEMNSELMAQSKDNYEKMRDQLDEHRSELKKSIRQLRGNFSSRCQLIGVASGLTAWTIFMAWVMWS
jgi:Zn-dependent M16 (insulinase) family peptidase|tara:strand:- start:227 stop:541 length:315 start_codon:yes stop_codon:yes gene_type:complete